MVYDTPLRYFLLRKESYIAMARMIETSVRKPSETLEEILTMCGPKEPPEGMLAEMHCHTLYSDGRMRVEEMIDKSMEAGTRILCITDHNTTKAFDNLASGREKLGKDYRMRPHPNYLSIEKKENRIYVVRAAEIKTNDGELLVYGYHGRVREERSLEDTLKEISDLGGFAVAAHPACIMGGIGEGNVKALNGHGKGIGEDKIESALDHGMLGIESFNAQFIFPMVWINVMGKEFSQKYDIPGIAGSDSHLTETLGCAGIVIPEQKILNPVELLRESIINKNFQRKEQYISPKTLLGAIKIMMEELKLRP